MLRKLLKYEFKATAKLILPLYLALIALSTINRFSLAFLETDLSNPIVSQIVNLLSGSLLLVYILALFLVYMGVYIYMIYRYYKNLFCEEGYLYMTLPVSSTSHIITKLITSFTWMVCSTIVAIASILIVVPSYDWIVPIFSDILELFGIATEMGMHVYWFVALLVLIVIVQVLSSFLCFFTAFSFGQTANKHKVACSIGAYFVIYTIIQTFMSIVFTMFMLPSIESTNPMLGATEGTSSIAYLINNQIIPFFFIVFIISLAISVGMFFINRYIIKNKLNLE